MTLQERLQQLMVGEERVELYFAPSYNYYLALITQVGLDYVEFDALDKLGMVVAHNIMPLSLLLGITTSSIEGAREQLESIYRRDE